MELKLPELGEGVHEGELVKWLVKAGDTIKDDQALCEIMTDKATIELPSPVSGVVEGLVAKEGQTVHVGETMLKFVVQGGAAAGAPKPSAEPAKSDPAKGAAPVGAEGSKGDAPKAAAPVADKSNASLEKLRPAAQSTNGSGATARDSAPSEPLTVGGPVSAAPATRKFARENEVDLGKVSASGPSGRVMMEDVQKFLTGGGSSAAPTKSARSGAASRAPAELEERIAFKGLRKKIAQKMRESKDHAAHFTYVEEADATALVALRAQAKELGAKAGVKVTYLPFVMKAMVVALKNFPILNSELDEEKGEIILKHYYNIALSVQTEDGLTAPVVKDVGNKSVLQIAQEIEDLVTRARAKKLTMDDLTGGTITLTNAGSIGGLFATPVINYPEVAILGFNKIFRKPVAKVIDGKEQVVIRDWTYFSISLDHRIVDGAIGAEYMKAFIQIIENPALMILG